MTVRIQEQCRSPHVISVHGGRIHAVATAMSSCNISKVFINDALVFDEFSLPSWTLEWILFYPFATATGQPVWFSWHSNHSIYDQVSSMPLLALCEDGSAVVNGTFYIQKAEVLLTYATTTSNLSTLLVHLSNTGFESRRIASVLVNGVDATSRVSNPSGLLIGGYPDSVLLQVPLSEPVRRPNKYFYFFS